MLVFSIPKLAVWFLTVSLSKRSPLSQKLIKWRSNKASMLAAKSKPLLGSKRVSLVAFLSLQA